MVDIRAARPGDRDAIAAFTTRTFAWGDYVADAFERWLAEPNGVVLVAADEDDRAIGMTRGSLLSPEEAWFQGIRVHPLWRRKGVARAMDRELLAWAAGAGARIARLLIEDWNAASIAHVESEGFRPVCRWATAERAVGEASPVPRGNGGRRVPTQERLRPAPSAEAEPAFMSWVGGDLSRAARGLFPVHWSFRRLTVDDLTRSARHGALYEGRTGWAIAAPDHDLFEAAWVETTEPDAYDMARAIVDLAAESGADRLRTWVPEVDWATTAFRRAGCDLRWMSVFARILGDG
jgi:GNAT superfamily N-acetyltransferase